MKSMSVEFWTVIAIVDIDIVDIDIGKNFLDFVEEMKGRKDILATSIDK